MGLSSMVDTFQKLRCARCGVGNDTDDDGNCAFCAHLSEKDLVEFEQIWLQEDEPPGEC